MKKKLFILTHPDDFRFILRVKNNAIVSKFAYKIPVIANTELLPKE